MSLSRVSYLESWEHQPPPFVRRRTITEDEENDDGQATPRASQAQNHDEWDTDTLFLSASYPSTLPSHTIRHKLSFNPYAGRGWAHSSSAAAAQAAIDEERRSLLPADEVSPGSVTNGRSKGDDPLAREIGFRDPNWHFAETTAAFEVSRSKRIAQVVVAVFYCLFAAGPVFGFAALKPVLIREGVYRDRCSQNELERGTNTCYGQETRLNLMFTIAAVATNICALPVGTVLDVYGPRVSGVIGSIFIAIGTLLFAFARHLPFDGYIPGYLFIALGGPFVFISSFQLSNTFPRRSGLILSLLTGAFDASSALFLVFRLINESTDGTFSVQAFFTLYLVVPLFIFVVEITLMPKTSYKTAGELVLQAEQNIVDDANDAVDPSIADREEGERQRQDRREHRQSIVSSIQELLDDNIGNRRIDDLIFDENNPEFASRRRREQAMQKQKMGKEAHTKPAAKHAAGGVWGVMHGASALQQIRSPWFILIALFTALQMLRINYFVATIRTQYDSLLSSPERSRRLNEFFDLALPVGGLLAIPFIGGILDNTSTPTVLAVLVSVSTTIGILGCIPGSIAIGYLNVALFVLYRPFYYTAVSDYVAKVFGFQTFGKVYGLVIALAGMCNFAQAGLDALTFKLFDRDPIPVNVALTVLVVVVGGCLVTYVSTKARALARSAGKIEERRSYGTV